MMWRNAFNATRTAVTLKVYLKRHKLQSSVVALFFKPCMHIPVAIIGVLKACATFISLDTQWPEKRIVLILQKLHISTILVHRNLVDTWKTLKLQCSVDEIHKTLSFVAVHVTFDGAPMCHDGTVTSVDKLAYVVTTSGTTGIPKLVKVPHKCIVPNITQLSGIFQVDSDDVVLLASPLTFDPSIVEIFISLSRGASIVIVADWVKLSPLIFHDVVLTRNHVTIIQATPSLIHRLSSIHAQMLGTMTSLRVLALGGEPCPTTDVLARWKHADNHTQIYNLYGISEVSCWATYHHITADELRCSSSQEIPLGKALQGTHVEVRSDGAGTGVLFIGGSERRCVIDNEAAVRDNMVLYRSSGDVVRQDENGQLWYIGRQDEQVKRFAKRINLLELHKVAETCKFVRQALAVMSKDKLYLVVSLLGQSTQMDHSNNEMVAALIAKIIGDNLPSFYQPDYIIITDYIHINTHGKMDKKKVVSEIEDNNVSLCMLPWSELSQHASSVRLGGRCLTTGEKPEVVVAVENPLIPCNKEAISYKLKQIWKDCVGSSSHPDDDTRFTLSGGDSLKAVHFMNRLETYLHVSLPLFIDVLLRGCFLDVLHYTLQTLPIVSDTADMNIVTSSHTGHTHNKDGTVRCTQCVPGESANCQILHTAHSEVCVSIHKAGYIHHYCDKPVTHHFRQSVHIHQLQQLKRVWCNNMGKCIDATPLVALYTMGGGIVYIGSHSHRLSAICLHTGHTLWQLAVQSPIEAATTLSSDGKYVIVGCHDGVLYCLDAVSGDVHWTFSTDGSIKGSAAVNYKTGIVYVGSHDSSIYALDIQHRCCVWQAMLCKGGIVSTPVLDDSHVIYTTTLAGHLIALKPESGQMIWSRHVGKPVFTTAALSQSAIYVTCVDGSVHAFNREGCPMWHYQTGDAIFSSPSILTTDTHNELIVFGSHDSYVYCVQSNGELVWKFKADSQVYSTPFLFCMNSTNTATKVETTKTLANCAETSGKVRETSRTASVSRQNDEQVVCHINDVTSSDNDSTHRQKRKRRSGHCLELESDGNKRHELGNVEKIGCDDDMSFYDRLSTTCSADINITSVEHITNTVHERITVTSSSVSLVAVCSVSGMVYIVRLSDAHLVMCYQLPAQVFSSAIVVSDQSTGRAYLLVGCRDDQLYCLQMVQ